MFDIECPFLITSLAELHNRRSSFQCKLPIRVNFWTLDGLTRKPLIAGMFCLDRHRVSLPGVVVGGEPQ